MLGVAVSALVVLAVELQAGRPRLAPWQLALAALAGLGTLIADLRPVQIAPQRRTSLGSAATMVGILLLPAGPAAAVAGGATLAANLLLGRPWYRSTYNGGFTVMAAVCASVVAHPPISAQPQSMLRAVAGTILYSAVAIAFASVAAALEGRQPILARLGEALRESWPQSLALDGTAVAVAALMVTAPWAAMLPLAFLPLVYRMNGALEGEHRARGQLATVLAAQRKFLTDVSHNVGSPLATILMNLTLLTETRLEGEERSALRDTRREVNRLAELFRRLRVLAETDEEIPLQMVRVDLNEMARDVVRAHAASARRKHIDLTWEEGSTNVDVQADPDLLRQAAANLVENAIRHSPRSGQVLVRVASQRRQAWLEVLDQGTGIDAQALPHIFDRFEHGPKGGSGIGLSIVRSVTERHGGEIEVDSQPGSTRFRIVLPAAPGRL